MLTLAVLGPVEVRRDGVLARVPGGKTTELLVRLALEAERRCVPNACWKTCGRPTPMRQL
ncbi:hypothetical protein [Pedococcus sp. 5OH_020]|uniref:hypothetical protein n=1 Tax=Pedococcus sp. 5OH_020 TaxID=2989814 RepID=UPI0022E9CA1A|nr:hypothetical protein [Pedococcus sp. 5OH_020]